MHDAFLKCLNYEMKKNEVPTTFVIIIYLYRIFIITIVHINSKTKAFVLQNNKRD